jgi:hypothetical protein
MSISFKPVAGYGVYVSDNLTDEGAQLLQDKYSDNLYNFIEGEFDLDYSTIGGGYSGDEWFVFNFQDPLNNIEEYHKFKEKLKSYGHLLDNVEPKWICDLYIY